MKNNTTAKLVIFLVLIVNMTLASAANNALKFSHEKYVAFNAFEMGRSLTFSSWVKFIKLQDHLTFLHFGDGKNSRYFLVGLEGDSGKLVFDSFDKNGNYTKVSDGANARSFGKVPVDGSWIHVVATINGSGKARLYANGALIGGQDNAHVPLVSVSDIYLGKYSSVVDGDYPDFQIDNFGIWKKELSAKEVESLYLDGVSGVSAPDYYWNFDQVSATTLTPVRGNVKGELINISESDWTVSDIPDKEERINNQKQTEKHIVTKGLMAKFKEFSAVDQLSRLHFAWKHLGHDHNCEITFDMHSKRVKECEGPSAVSPVESYTREELIYEYVKNNPDYWKIKKPTSMECEDAKRIKQAMMNIWYAKTNLLSNGAMEQVGESRQFIQYCEEHLGRPLIDMN